MAIKTAGLRFLKRRDNNAKTHADKAKFCKRKGAARYGQCLF